MDTLLFLAGTWIGLLILPLGLIGITILLIKQISDDPTNTKKPYFFTAVEPGRIKAVVRGGVVRRYLMNNPGHEFSREGGDRTKDIYWNVEREKEDASEEKEQEHLLTPEPFKLFKFLFWPFFFRQQFRWYVWTVYLVTGHRFVGIWPFQTLHIYHFTRKMPKLDERGKPATDAEGLPILEDRLEPTDHVRARVFVWHVQGQAGETVEGLKIRVRGMANVRTTNPQEALFGADRWDVVLTSTILRTLASNIRTMPVNEVLTAVKEGTKDKLAEAVMKDSNKKLEVFGLIIDNYQIVDFDAQLSQEDAAALTAKWRAERKKEAEQIRGEGVGLGRAAEITKVAEATEKGGEDARRAQESEALIRQASEAGNSGGVVIIGGQQNDSGINAALLTELKKLNQKFPK